MVEITSTPNDLFAKGDGIGIENPNPPPNTISFHLNDRQVEMLRIAPDGFYVRGVKLEQDANEARALFDAFVEFFNKAKAIGESSHAQASDQGV